MLIYKKGNKGWGFPGGSVVKNLPVDVGDMVRSLIWEDPTCLGASRPMGLNC